MIARKATALIAAFALGCSSCATLIYGGGTQQTVSISTQPPGATIEVADQRAVSPAEVVLDRYTTHRIVATKPGYVMATATIGPTYSWATVLDLILVLPWLVDMVSNGVYTLGPESNAIWTFSPNSVDLVLTPVSMPQVTPPK